VSPRGTAACFIHKKMLPRDHSFSFAAATAKETSAAGSCAEKSQKASNEPWMCLFFAAAHSQAVRMCGDKKVALTGQKRADLFLKLVNV
jgi:hypothetical protein